MKSLLRFIAIGIPFLSISQNDTTLIGTTMFTEVSGKSNVVYCASLELLWSEFTEYLGEQPIPEQLHIEINNLNTILTAYEIPLEEKYWFAKVGLIKDGIVDSIANTYQSQFGMHWTPRDYKSEDLIGHSYLQKNINFYSRLGDNFYDFKFKDSSHVKCFGLDGGWANPTYKKQLKIHDYINEDNFIFQMGCKDTLDEIYFAKVPSNGNLLETYNAVMDRINMDSLRTLGNFDQLKIPYLKFDITKDFESLKGVYLANPSYRQLMFKELSQRISFDLNKDGIRIESSAELIIDFADSDIEPIIYAFDQPFLIIAKRKGKPMPYFLYWVQNSDHMELLD
ncbi:MAG: hypothetical protein ACI837_001492 [Crocinitomicaceae bacterium]|jgi:hypothetical protein